MKNDIRAVFIGFSHMHVNEIASYIFEKDGITAIGGADIPAEIPENTDKVYTRAWNLRHVSETFGVPIYDNYREMLDSLKPDIAFILCENDLKLEVVRECAKRGIAVSVEKPLGISSADAIEIKRVAEEAGIEAMVNWPTTWRPYIHKLAEAYESNIVGKLKRLYYINGHTGPFGVGTSHRGVDSFAEPMTDEERSRIWFYQKKHGGGVILDISCYGAMYSNLFFGKLPDSVTAKAANLGTPYSNTYDNASAVMKYGDALATIEATWTAPQSVLPTGPILFCEKGVISCTPDKDITVTNLYGETLEVKKGMPKIYKNIADIYVEHKKNGVPLYKTLEIDFNIGVMKILDMINESVEK